MAAGRLPEDEYVAVAKTFAIISSIAITSVAIYHIYTTQKNVLVCFSQSVFLSMTLLFFAVLVILGITLEIFDDFHTAAFCSFSKFVTVPSYIAFKCMLYIILVNRSYLAFGDSPYSVWSAKKLKIWASTLVIWSVLNIVFNIATTTTRFDADGYPKCFTFVFRPMLMSMMALDIIACGVNLYLFIKPIKELNAVISLNAVSENELDGQMSILQYIAVKQCVLSIIAIITSVFTNMLIALFSLVQVFIGLDVNVSIICVILMYKWNDSVVKKLCCLCIKDRTNKVIPSKRNLDATVPTGTTTVGMSNAGKSRTGTPTAGTSSGAAVTISYGGGSSASAEVTEASGTGHSNV